MAPEGPVKLAMLVASKLLGSTASLNVRRTWSTGLLAKTLPDGVLERTRKPETPNEYVKRSAGSSPGMPLLFWSNLLPYRSCIVGARTRVYDPVVVCGSKLKSDCV